MPKTSFYSGTGLSSEDVSTLTQLKTDAETASASAATSETNSAASETSSAASATAAAASAAQAASSSSDAVSAKNISEAAQAAAETAETSATSSASSATASAAAAASSETNAASSATSASGSASTATTKASEASTSATASEASRVASVAAQAAAETAETNAASSATASASSASASAASETASAASETAAAASETAAATSETNAAASQVASAASETASAASETAAAASQVAAASSETNAEAAWDSLDDRYLGAKATAPTLDNDGDALLVGGMYWNSASDAMYVWNGSSWDSLPTSIGIADGATSTQVTITDTDTTLNRLRITATDDASLAGTAHGLQVGDTAGVNIAIDGNEILARDNGAAGTLKLQVEGGNVDFNSGATGSCNLTMGNTTFLDEDRNATFASVKTNEIRGYGNVVSYHADYDASSAGNQGHLFIANNSDNPYGGFFNNDFYIQDNLNVGRYYRADGTNQFNTDGTSAITVYSSNTSTGPANYKNYTQLLSRNSTDPDYAILMASSAYVESQTPDTAENDQHAFVIDNGGRMWAWQSFYAGRTRRGDSGTTSNYRVGDHGFTGYSNTGGTQGEGSYNGYTQIVGRETPNSDVVFRVQVAGSDRIHFYSNGNGYFDGGADLGNADYAEYFEWADGNPDNEDRRGHSVVLTTDGKMRIATSEDDTADFLGIVSVHAAICGDAAPMSWQGKYQLDKFGGRVLVDINHTCWMDKPDGEYNDSDQWDHKYTDEYISSNNIAVPDYAKVITTQVPVESDGYEQDREYIPRKDRKEWQAIGLMGKLPLLKGQPTAPQWRKLYDLNDEVEMWLVR